MAVATLETAPRRRRRYVLALVAAAVLAASVLWLPLAAGAVWPGTTVVERCDRAAAEVYGKEAVFAVRGGHRVRWWPPGWRCSLDNGESITVSPWP